MAVRLLALRAGRPLTADKFLVLIFRGSVDFWATQPRVTKALFPGVKRPGHEADHSHAPSADDTNAGSYTSISPYVSAAWNLLKKRGRQIYIFENDFLTASDMEPV
jgi:hypothetical protein